MESVILLELWMRAMGTNVHEACITLFYILLHSMECVECWYVMVTAIAQFGTMYVRPSLAPCANTLVTAWWNMFTELVSLVPVLSLFIHSCLLSLFHWCTVVLSVCPVVEGLTYMVYVTVYTLHVLCMGSPDLCAGQVMPYLVVMWLTWLWTVTGKMDATNSHHHIQQFTWMWLAVVWRLLWISCTYILSAYAYSGAQWNEHCGLIT